MSLASAALRHPHAIIIMALTVLLVGITACNVLVF